MFLSLFLFLPNIPIWQNTSEPLGRCDAIFGSELRSLIYKMPFDFSLKKYL